jgi:protein-S-isoprenylcysteine O-methyltransferase Ste14
VILLLFSFLVFRIIVRKDYLNNLKLSPFSYLLELIIFVLHANFIYLFIPVKWPNLPSLPENILLKLMFIFFIFIGLLILLIAWFNLGTGTSFGQDKNNLKTTGIYRYSRNPQLIGYGIILLAYFIIIISWYSAGWFILYLIISWFMVQSEEEFLKKKYNIEYENYCQNVPRFIGRFRKLHG